MGLCILQLACLVLSYSTEYEFSNKKVRGGLIISNGASNSFLLSILSILNHGHIQKKVCQTMINCKARENTRPVYIDNISAHFPFFHARRT
jgi:hypothetical protein